MFVDPGAEYLLFSDVVNEVNVRFAAIQKKRRKRYAFNFGTNTNTGTKKRPENIRLLPAIDD